MMTSPHTNKEPSQVRFKGPDDVSIRSAWSTTNRSFKPPSPAERKPTLGKEGLDQAKKNALAAAEVLCINGVPKPSAPVPILKVGLGSNSNHNSNNEQPKPSSPDTSTNDEYDMFDVDAQLFSSRPHGQNQRHQDCRSAWTSTETRHSASSIFGPSPARRQKTLDEFDLREAATITAMADLETIRDTKNRERSNAGPRDARW